MPFKNSTCINILIFITVIATICCALLDPLFYNVFHMSGPGQLFGLSWPGLSNYYIWQPITNLFVQADANGIDLYFLINLTFNMYMLWLFGSDIVEEYGSGSFIKLYLISGILASLAALFSLHGIWVNQIIAGCAPSILAIFAAWAIIHRDAQLFLFFVLPVSSKILLGVVVAISLLIPLSHFDLTTFVYYFVGILTGYIYATAIWGAHSPFAFTAPLDDFLNTLGNRIQSKIERLKAWKTGTVIKTNKIVDIKTGKPVQNDDEFMDEMLAKISHYGEKSLTRQERDRMRVISENKMNSQK